MERATFVRNDPSLEQLQMILVEDFKPHAATLKSLGWDYPYDIESLSSIEAQLLMNIVELHQKNKKLENQSLT